MSTVHQVLDNAALCELFIGLDTAGISDALDKLGIHGQALDIMPLQDYATPIVGIAFTVKYVPAGIPAGTVGDYIDDVSSENIVVIDNDGRTDCTVWGDILTQYAGIKGIKGTVIDGVCRDVNKAISDQYPVFSKGRFMRTGKDRVEVESVNQTVTIGTVRVSAGDVIIGDASGVVVVPQKHAQHVAEVSRQVEDVESKIREQIQQGKTIKQARESLGYHTLQRKQ